ncbi:MAG: helix-turn-helix domain-containing protein [Desulfobacterales bacterium]|nr:helix-turn-helix domain-containing protein [Desulfobacterales bacterium]
MLMSKTELAKQADVSPITISRIERGLPCRLETQRKILLALGMQLADKPKLFKD